ncbi:hypothetical protein F5882DRAFT_153462 [Hyaloscypha sp. PMI_1271]|nr:hypothetical protein F5882DRAFT_153462 [Hyaloscypha sp. PMI_1271]
MLPSFHASLRPCCHVPVALPIPSLNPGCFSSPSVFRTRIHERPRPRPRPRGPLLFSRARCFVSASHCHRRHPLHRCRAAEGSGIQMKSMSRDPPETTPESLLRFAINETCVEVVRQERDQFAISDQKTRRQSPLSFFMCYPQPQQDFLILNHDSHRTRGSNKLLSARGPAIGLSHQRSPSSIENPGSRRCGYYYSGFPCTFDIISDGKVINRGIIINTHTYIYSITHIFPISNTTLP